MVPPGSRSPASSSRRGSSAPTISSRPSAAKKRVHIQKHQRVPDELLRNPAILGPRSSTVVDAFRYLDHNARAKFVYGNAGTRADLAKARKSFETIESICREVLG